LTEVVMADAVGTCVGDRLVATAAGTFAILGD